MKKKLPRFTLSGYVHCDNEDLATFTTLTHLTCVQVLFLQPSAMPLINLIPKLTNLSKLRLNSSQIVVDPNPILQSVTNLTALSFRIPSSESINPQYVSRLTSLRYLDLTFQDESKFPSCLTQLDLHSLYLRKVTSMPPTITKFTSLHTLGHVNSNCELPNELVMMTQLRRLLFQTNTYITAVPDLIFQMTQLTSLGLVGLDLIRYIPPEISRLILLQDLQISHSSVVSLPYEDLSKLSHLRTLDLIGLSCPWVPPQLSEGTHVQGGTKIPPALQDPRLFKEFSRVHTDLFCDE